MRTSRLARLVGRGAVLAAVGFAAVGAASPAIAADFGWSDRVSTTTIEWASTIEWSSAPLRDPSDEPAGEPGSTGLEERTIEWS
jgi:hypothetical protein